MNDDELIAWYQKRAKEIWSSTEIEFWEYPTVTIDDAQAGEGAFVSAWVWVPAPEVDEDDA